MLLLKCVFSVSFRIVNTFNLYVLRRTAAIIHSAVPALNSFSFEKRDSGLASKNIMKNFSSVAHSFSFLIL